MEFLMYCCICSYKGVFEDDLQKLDSVLWHFEKCIRQPRVS